MTDGRTDGGDCNIPEAFLKKRGDNKNQEKLGPVSLLICFQMDIQYKSLKYPI